MSKKDLAETAVAFYLDARCEEMQTGMRELLSTLDGSGADRPSSRDDPRGTRLGRRRRGRHVTMAGLARATLRCLREDLAQTVPRADSPLEGISHPLLAKATSASPTTRRRTNGSPPSAPCRPS